MYYITWLVQLAENETIKVGKKEHFAQTSSSTSLAGSFSKIYAWAIEIPCIVRFELFVNNDLAYIARNLLLLAAFESPLAVVCTIRVHMVV